MRRIFFRCEANSESGFGHFARCIQISKFLDKNEIQFIGNYNELAQKILKENNIKFHFVEAINHFTIEDIQKYVQPNDLVIIDSYIPEQIFYDELNSSSLRWGAFDDFNDLEFEGAEFVLNFRLSAEEFTNYKSKKKFLNVDFMPIDEQFINLREQVLQSEIAENIGSVLIFIGTSDLHEISLKVAQFVKDNFSSFKVRLVMSSNVEYPETVEGVELIQMNSNVAQNLVDVDLVITGGGKFKYETCFVGVPNITISQTKGQHEDTVYFASNKLSLDSGLTESLDLEKLKNNIDFLMSKKERLVLRSASQKIFKTNSNQNLSMQLSEI